MGQVHGLQPLQLRPGRDAQLLGQAAAHLGEAAQGVGLAAGPVERGHAQRPQPLPQRMLAAQALQLPGDRGVAAQREIGFGAGLRRQQGELVQPGPLGDGEGGDPELGQRLTGRSANASCRRAEARGVAGSQRRARSHQFLEAGDVDGGVGQEVAARAGHHRGRPDDTAQLRDLHPQRVRRGCPGRRRPTRPPRDGRRSPTPRRGGPTARAGPAALGPRTSKPDTPGPHLKLAEKANFHRAHATAAADRANGRGGVARWCDGRRPDPSGRDRVGGRRPRRRGPRPHAAGMDGGGAPADRAATARRHVLGGGPRPAHAHLRAAVVDGAATAGRGRLRQHAHSRRLLHRLARGRPVGGGGGRGAARPARRPLRRRSRSGRRVRVVDGWLRHVEARLPPPGPLQSRAWRCRRRCSPGTRRRRCPPGTGRVCSASCWRRSSSCPATPWPPVCTAT